MTACVDVIQPVDPCQTLSDSERERGDDEQTSRRQPLDAHAIVPGPDASVAANAMSQRLSLVDVGQRAWSCLVYLDEQRQ